MQADGRARFVAVRRPVADPRPVRIGRAVSDLRFGALPDSQWHGTGFPFAGRGLSVHSPWDHREWGTGGMGRRARFDPSCENATWREGNEPWTADKFGLLGQSELLWSNRPTRRDL